MKRIIPYLFLLFPILAQAQMIPNGSFENWVADTSNPLDPTAQVPESWLSLSFGGAISKGTTGAQAGSAYLKIKTGSFFGSVFPGLLLNQWPATTTFRYLNGYLRKTTSGDTLAILAGFKRDTLAVYGGGGQSILTYPQWSPFSIEIFPFSSVTPDSAFISILVSGQGNGSGFDIDNLSFGNTAIGPVLSDPTSVKQVKNHGLVAQVSPNPASEWPVSLVLSRLTGKNMSVKIMDMLGKTVWQAAYPVRGESQVLSIGSGISEKGLYHIVIDNGGRRMVLPLVKN